MPAADLPTNGTATGEPVTLLPGAAVTCTITNDDIQPILTLVKNVVNDDGGALDVADFALSVEENSTPSPATSGTPQTVTANTPLIIAEAPKSGYSVSAGWSCLDGNNIMPAADLPTNGTATGEPCRCYLYHRK